MTYSTQQHVDGRSATNATVVAGMMAGIAGGLAGAWMMNRFQGAWSRASQMMSDGQKEPHTQQSGRQEQSKQEQAKKEPATARAAEAVSEQVFDHELTAREKKTAEPAVHYAFGALMGGLYGSLTAWRRETAIAGGLPFGTAVWLFADEIGVPAAGLSPSSLKSPLSSHVNALVSHLVYGATTEAVRRGVLASAAALR